MTTFEANQPTGQATLWKAPKNLMEDEWKILLIILRIELAPVVVVRGSKLTFENHFFQVKFI